MYGIIEFYSILQEIDMGLKIYDFSRSGKKPYLKILYVAAASRTKPIRMTYRKETNSLDAAIKMTDSVVDQMDMKELYYAEISMPYTHPDGLASGRNIKMPYCMALNDDGRVVMAEYHEVMGYDKESIVNQYRDWKKTKQPFYKFLEFKAL